MSLKLSTMKRFLYFIAFLVNLVWLQAQVVVTTPSFPTLDGAITITYDATKGQSTLIGYTGDVYAHTGLLTSASTDDSDWKYAPAWGNNATKYKMTPLGGSKWQLVITPDIRGYYVASDTDVIEKMAFAFRS